MLLATGAVIVGFIVLVWGADRFVMGAAALARNLGLPPLLIGLTVVGFGTSAPEILVSLTASLQGAPELAVGNAIGSNIANIGLILGVTALVAPLLVKSDVLRREYPILLVISVMTFFMLSDGQLNRTDGVVLLLSLVVVLYLIVRIGRARAVSDPIDIEFEAEIRTDLSTFASSMWTFAGLVLLLVSSRLLVWGAVQIATALGVSDLVIGLTIVAIGTSLPELAAGVVSALKNEHDIAVGNVIGSNIFNLLAVLAVPGLITTTAISASVIHRDLPVMLALTLALYLLGRGRDGHGHIDRWEGALLLTAFVGYQFWLYLDANPHLGA
jgi:cation:H+ antiporter